MTEYVQSQGFDYDTVVSQSNTSIERLGEEIRDDLEVIGEEEYEGTETVNIRIGESTTLDRFYDAFDLDDNISAIRHANNAAAALDYALNKEVDGFQDTAIRVIEDEEIVSQGESSNVDAIAAIGQVSLAYGRREVQDRRQAYQEALDELEVSGEAKDVAMKHIDKTFEHALDSLGQDPDQYDQIEAHLRNKQNLADMVKDNSEEVVREVNSAIGELEMALGPVFAGSMAQYAENEREDRSSELMEI